MASSRKPARSKPAGKSRAPALAGSAQPFPLIRQSIEASLERAGARGASVCVALSGGVDSVVLLHGLASIARRFGLALSALHANHGLSQSAYAWERNCRRLCLRLRIPLTVKRVKVPARRGLGLEAAARIARYAALSAVRSDFVALAHQLDDQAETVLLNLLRGAGLRGAAAMPEIGHLPASDRGVTDEGAPRALRPLLAVPREAIVGYAIAQRLHWDEDESNADEALSRNWVRRSVGPVLAARYPRWRESLARAAAHFGEADALLERNASERLTVAQLRAAPKGKARLRLRAFLRAGGTRAPDAKQLDEMLRQLLDARADAGLEIAHDGMILRRYRDELALQPASALRGRVEFHPATGAGIDAAKYRARPVTVRVRQGGERLRLVPGGPSRTLKNLFQEGGVPPWERDSLPLVYIGDELVWVPGVGIAAAYRASRGRPGLVPEWIRYRQD